MHREVGRIVDKGGGIQEGVSRRERGGGMQERRRCNFRHNLDQRVTYIPLNGEGGC